MNNTIKELPAHWKPDPRWPDIVIEMARNCAMGIDDRGPLADWFEEQGMTYCTDWLRAGDEWLGMGRKWTKGYLLGLIVGDGYEDVSDGADVFEGELYRYLASRTL